MFIHIYYNMIKMETKTNLRSIKFVLVHFKMLYMIKVLKMKFRGWVSEFYRWMACLLIIFTVIFSIHILIITFPYYVQTEKYSLSKKERGVWCTNHIIIGVAFT